MTASRRTSVRAVLLDIDDTLVDTRAAFGTAIDAAVRRWVPGLDDEGRARAVLRWAQDPLGAFRRFTAGELDLAAQRRIRVVDLHDAFDGPEVDDELFAAWDDLYEVTFRGAWRATPDGLRLVETLERSGVPFGVVTNLYGGYQADKLAAVGLDRVRILGSLDTVGVGKPDPRIFLAGCAALGVEPGGVAYVGDEPDVDAVGATQAGLVGVWLDRFSGGGVDPRPDGHRGPPRITSLDQLGDVLDIRPDLGAGVAGR
jgi:putative hydrolase of the HAD superfamily